MPRRRYRSWLAIAAVASVAAVAAGCLGADRDPADPAGRNRITIGLIAPESGPNKAAGADLVNGFQLYLDLHGGKLGGHRVRLVVADEGDGRQTTAQSARRLIEQERVSALVGTLTGEATLSLHDAVTRAKLAFIGTGARPSGLDDLRYLWHVSWLPREPGAAIAEHLRTALPGPVYVIGVDHQSGHENIAGFTDTFTGLGGKLANEGGRPVWTQPNQPVNYTPYFNKIAASGAKAVYAFYTGWDATEFVRQYAQSQLHNTVPLLSSGFLTDEGLLAAEGPAADGVQTTLTYAADLDTATNRGFVTEFTKHFDTPPRVLNVTSYDAATVLDRAIAAAGRNPSREAINAQIGKIGALDSPRGTWRWSVDHTPIQSWYLRQVAIDGRGRANVLVKSLATLGRSS